MLKAKNIQKKYAQTQILSGVDLDVETGKSVAICGRSGEGKTTLLHILGSLEAPDQGTVEIDGKVLSPSSIFKTRNHSIGFIFQSYNLLEDFSALENVLMPAKVGRKKVDQNQGMDLLSLVGLEHKADLLAKHLSGGERQRIAIARAFCNDTKLIFADEPTGNLDAKTSREIANLLISTKKTLVLVTHDLHLASLCDEMFFLEAGKLRR